MKSVVSGKITDVPALIEWMEEIKDPRSWTLRWRVSDTIAKWNNPTRPRNEEQKARLADDLIFEIRKIFWLELDGFHNTLKDIESRLIDV